MTNVLALTGPPAAGKSTICDFLRDLDIPVKSTGQLVRDRANEKWDDPSEDQIWSYAEDLRSDLGAKAPTCLCRGWIKEQDADLVVVSDLREDEEVEWLRDQIGPTLVVRIDTSTTETRINRYIDRELGGDRVGVSSNKISELRAEVTQREKQEMPYPTHDVTILNDNDVTTTELIVRLDHLTSVMQ